MHIFLYEYTCALGRTGSLHTEGWAMLRAVTEDFAKVPGAETITLLAETCTAQLGQHCWRATGDKEEESFRKLAGQADFTLVIAPEFDDILAERCRWVLEAGGRLLGSEPEAVSAAADKLHLAARLKECSVPSPPTEMASDDQPRRWFQFPAVCKPRFGAGSQATFFVRSADQLEKGLTIARQEMPAGAEFILQPFVPGMPASVAVLLGPAGKVPLLPAGQHLLDNGRFRYQGGEAPLPAQLAERAQRLAMRGVSAIPSLLGYIGIDLVLGEAKDGSQDYVIEINPRFTTSYIGLRQLARTNLVQVLLELISGKEIHPLEWRFGKVRFLADGTLLP
jgi:predicted ATP-grasp superfamily ATP-dependent carboligase